MKWTLYVVPNQCFDEEFPDGWTRDEVLKAANNRYGGKVTGLGPSAIGSSDDDDSYQSSSFGSLGESFGGVLVIGGIIGIIVFWEAILIMALVGVIGTGALYGIGRYLNWKN